MRYTIEKQSKTVYIIHFIYHTYGRNKIIQRIQCNIHSCMYFPVVAVEFSVLAGCFNLLRVEKPRAIIIGICIQFAKLRKRFPSDISSLLESRNAIFQCKF